MVKIITYVFPLLLLANNAMAQEENSDRPLSSVFVEIGGKGFGSINFDYRFLPRHSFSIGVTMFDYSWIDYSAQDSLTGKTLPTPSIMYYYLRGKNGHYLELGCGASILPYFKVDYGENDSPYTFHGVIGYRLQRSDHFFFRAGFTPFYRVNWAFLPLIGVSFGYNW